jgi:hypothetical protein
VTDAPTSIRIARSKGGLREGESGFTEFFHEHGERLIVGSIGAVAGGDTYRLRSGGQGYQLDTFWE